MYAYPRGQVAFVCGMMLILGHFLFFAIIWINTSISPTSKSDLFAIIIPITVASVTSAVIYAVKHAEMKLSETPDVNAFFLAVSIVIPGLFFLAIFWGLWRLDGEDSVKNFKTYIVTAEAMFGGIFVIVTEALFGSQRSDNAA